MNREEIAELTDYDPGLLNDYGGGNVGWWQEYIRNCVNSCNEHWRAQIDTILTLFPSIEVEEECPECGGSGEDKYIKWFPNGNWGEGKPIKCTTCHGEKTITRRIPITSEQAQGMYDLLNAMRPELHAQWKYRIQRALSFLTGKETP